MEKSTYIITVNGLVDDLSDYAKLDTSSKILNDIINDFIDGFGMPDICKRNKLSTNLQVAERTIRKKLREVFKNNPIVDNEIIDDIMVAYYRLLFFSMVVEGEKELVKFRKNNHIVRHTGKPNFVEGAVRYLGNLPYNLLVHLIPQNFLFSYYVNGSNATNFVNMMTKIENRKIKFKDFGKGLGFWGDILNDYVEKQLDKMNIKITEGHLIDSKTGERITFLDVEDSNGVAVVGEVV